MAQFELLPSRGVIPKRPRFYQRAEGSPVAHRFVAGDHSLLLKTAALGMTPLTKRKDSFEIQTEPPLPDRVATAALGGPVERSLTPEIGVIPTLPVRRSTSSQARSPMYDRETRGREIVFPTTKE